DIIHERRQGTRHAFDATVFVDTFYRKPLTSRSSAVIGLKSRRRQNRRCRKSRAHGLTQSRQTVWRTAHTVQQDKELFDLGIRVRQKLEGGGVFHEWLQRIGAAF